MEIVKKDDSLYSKLKKGEITNKEYNEISAKRRGFNSSKEYRDFNAKKKGFEDDNDCRRQDSYDKGIYSPMSENKDCALYLGVHIAERILPLIFDNVKKMSNNNIGYDYICNNDYKIDVKSSVSHEYKGHTKKWTFHIHKNKITDYFLMIAFDNRIDLNIMHIWLVRGNNIIEKLNNYNYKCDNYTLNNKYAIDISGGKNSLKRWKKYEITDKLEEIQKVCDEFKINEFKMKGEFL